MSEPGAEGDLVRQARELVEHEWRPIAVVTGCRSTREFVGKLADEIERLQGVIDAGGEDAYRAEEVVHGLLNNVPGAREKAQAWYRGEYVEAVHE